MANESKKCNTCDSIKHLSEFNQKQGKCKACQKQYLNSYYIKNKERHNTQTRDWTANNKDFVKEYNRDYYENNKESYKEKCKEYKANNSERIYARQREWYLKNRDRLLQKASTYRENNKEKIAQWKQSDKAKLSYLRSNNKRRILKKMTSDGTIPAAIRHPLTEELQGLLNKQKNKCYLCKTELDKSKQLDHWIPLSKGGTDTISNVVWLCRLCNQRKHASVPKTLLLV